jgi:adenylylsulfate kinase
MKGVIWITGLSASGKSTIAKEVIKQLRKRGYDNSIMLDGDEIRTAIADPYTQYDRDSRLRNAYRISRISQLLAEQEQIVVTATISLFHEIHLWNKTHVPNYYEIMIQTNEALRKQRSPEKFHHITANSTSIDALVGVHIKPEYPLNPHHLFENTDGLKSIPDNVKCFLQTMTFSC